ncbi:beta-galactosidase [Mucilaginibacter achroorhodeus]|uniref:Beta-galactosidase n=1 Tax=Mucilaginibacter achroorhodeus TaxID=2599294 RepID=A0A563UAZ6_9SPHI|nr:beta-galactosidase trimerization domain-containing protein [Mucilaginibacter achroorhodeus]TWR28449.1 beta-galactosidase [Mucilaginibacter achroorhodeus]
MSHITKQEATPILFGAEVFIEPGQQPEEIDLWFRRLSDAGMLVTRIRLFENYMHQPDGTWDYTLFDEAYKAADKYGVKVYGNLFPRTAFTDLGGLKFPKDAEHLISISKYIEYVVGHFKQFSSCYGWVPVNEPGVGSFPQEEFATDKYKEWREAQQQNEYNSGGYDRFDFADERFHLYYNTWFLQWLTDEIQKHHPGSVIHVNNHAIFKNVAEYDFPAWRDFLTSLGGSAHASWHFGYFNRQQYALAVNANCEIIRSGAGEIPWFMTELQGGNNTYSGFLALCPTKFEIAQWLWTAIGAESRGAIFWCLNPRSSGIEAGEWAMLNYHNEPSDRFTAAAEVIKVVESSRGFFDNVKEVESGVNILYTRESLWIEKTLQMGGKSYEGRDEGGVMKSAIAYFEALSEAGIQTNFKEISEFDFNRDSYKGTAIILAHQISIPSKYWPLLTAFVTKGGKLIADGLTGYYDENAVATMRLGFPLREVFGADVLEYKAIDNIEEFTVVDAFLPALQWVGQLKPTTATPLAESDGEVYATVNQKGQGSAWWIPTLTGLGCRVYEDYNQLNQFLKHALDIKALNLPFMFNEPQPGVMMKVLNNGKEYVTIIVNKSENRCEFALLNNKPSLQPMVLFANCGGKAGGNHISIEAEETMVIKWL